MFTLDSVVPWGRSFDEYQRMFALSGADLQLRILGCADGPAGFNPEAARRHLRVTSCDPLYRFTGAQIRARIDATFNEMLDQAGKNRHEFVWESIRSLDELARVRRAAMETFLDDYPGSGGYVAGELPALPFSAGAFDLTLCSHFLFLYSPMLAVDFHLAAVRELLRVAREVRIFPLLALGSERSPYVDPVMEAMRRDGHDVAVVTVPYEFQRGGNQMLRILNSEF
jgi:hypothetical protein